MKKITLLSFILALACGNSLFAQTKQKNDDAKKDNIIPEVSIQTDYVENGVKGFRIGVSPDFNLLRKKYPVDSVFKKALTQGKFAFKLSLFQDTTPLKPAFGYLKAFGKSDFIEIKRTCNPVFQEENKASVVTQMIFIPYASLKLKEGKQVLSVTADFSGKDGFNTPYKQTTKSAVFTFIKPLTKIFEVSLDSLVVNTLDNNGQAWDHELFGTDAPDLDFSIKMGDLEVGNIHKGNNYKIAFPQKPRIFRFLISENDEITIFLVDMDDAFHDPIASWRFNTTNMKEGANYEQKENKANMKAFSFRCKVGKAMNQKELEMK
ncbi:MAG: hypothetical protein ACO1N0_14020 [Fluviicola sp.]